MKTVTQKFDITSSEDISNTCVFLDIETTGLMRARSMVYLIGCACVADKTIYVTQWFAESIDEEALIISACMDYLNNFSKIITYNGQNFDIPFLEAKCAKYNINCMILKSAHTDLYKEVLAMKNILKLPDYKQKTVEAFMNIDRDDECSGKELIKDYYMYLSTHKDYLYDRIMLHNSDDVKGLIKLYSVTNYSQLKNKNYTITVPDIQEGNLIILLSLNNAIPRPIAINRDFFSVEVDQNSIKISVPFFQGKLKHYFDNYKEYYYLPYEDIAIHKSVAEFVDKNYRQRATKANCYTKKEGLFLPQPSAVIEPVFKQSENDKICYFLYSKDVFTSKNLSEYASQIIDYCINS